MKKYGQFRRLLLLAVKTARTNDGENRKKIFHEVL